MRPDTKADVEKLIKDLPEWPDQNPLPVTGVLLSNHIAQLADDYKLLDPFDKGDCLKPAAYELRVGNEYAMRGEYKVLSKEAGGVSTLAIDPFEVAVIKTMEFISMPRFLVARWDIRVSLAYEGLVWVGGPQVDPGYQGYLFCPVYNLSAEPVTLHLEERFATMDFSTTPTPTRSSKKFNRGKNNRLTISDYHADKLRSALSSTMLRRLNELEKGLSQARQVEIPGLEKEVRRAQSTQMSWMGVIFAVLTVTITAIAIIATTASGKGVNLAGWAPVTALFVSLAALVLGIIALIRK